MRRMKKIVATTLVLAFAMMPGVSAKADAVTEKPYISLGADLTAEEKDKVLALLGVTEEDLPQYEVVEVTNEDEHEYLGDYMSASVIGSRALSSVRIKKLEEGEGIGVETKNITYCTSGMYTNALTTAGITDAQVIVAGPFEISGTAALVGAMQAYTDMTGEIVTKENADAATNELVVTGELGQSMGAEEAEQFVALVKQKVLDGKLDSQEEIQKAIHEAAEQVGVTVTDEQMKQLTDLMNKIKDLNLDVDKLKQQADEVYSKLKELDINVEEAKGIFQKLVDYFNRIAQRIAALFS